MKSYRGIWAITLLFYISGCTAYAPAYLPGDNIPDQPSVPDASATVGETGYSPGVLPDEAHKPLPPSGPEMVRVGLGVRLTMVNGETVEGSILEITDDALVFGKPSNYGRDYEYYAFKNIAKIEVPHSTGLTKTLTVTFLVLGAMTTAFFAAGFGLYMSDTN